MVGCWADVGSGRGGGGDDLVFIWKVGRSDLQRLASSAACVALLLFIIYFFPFFPFSLFHFPLCPFI